MTTTSLRVRASGCTLALMAFVACVPDADTPSADDVPPPGPPSASAPTVSMSVAEQVTALLPGVDFGRSSFEPDTTGPYGVTRFSYQSATADWPFGSGFAVSEKGSDRLLWLYLHHGDFPPHAFRWADFDADGRDDIFFHAGFEDVFETHVYLNRLTSTDFGLLNFALGYRNDEVYATPVDMEGDGYPELLVGEPSAEEEAGPFCAPRWNDPEVEASVRAEYERLVGPFAGFAFRYGTDAYPLINMSMLDRIRIVRLYGGPRFATSNYPVHVRWRIEILERLRGGLGADCGPALDEVRRYLEGLLEG